MSRQLPARPNLEYLKKQAKALLEDLTRADPNTKLADALHALAREYGFVSWPALKAHVVSIPGTAAQASPFAGHWSANYARSRRHPLDDSRSATLQFTVVGDTVTLVDVVTDSAGAERRGENTLEADGNEYVSERGNGYAVCARWAGARVLDVGMTKGGQDVGRVTYTVSDDDKTLMVSAAAKAHNQYPAADHEIVFDRVIPG